MLKVLQILSVPHGKRIGVNGPEIRIFRMLDYWQEADIEPVIVYPREGQQWDAFKAKGVSLRHFSWIHVFSFFHLLRLVGNEKPDVIHNQGPIPLDFLSALVGRIKGIPVVITRAVVIDDLINHPPWQRCIYGWVDRMTIRLASCFISICETGKQSLLERSGIPESKIELIYNGTSVERFSTGKQEERHCDGSEAPVVLGVVCQLAKTKGLKDYVEIVKRLRDAGLNVTGLIVGDGPLFNELQALVEQQGLKGHITFAGFQSDVAPWFEKMDLLLFPSYREGLSVAILEAMASGLPVIATNVGGTREQVVDGVNGFVAEPGDVDRLFECASTLVRDASLREKMGAESRTRVEAMFSERAMFEKHAECYKRLRKI